MPREVPPVAILAVAPIKAVIGISRGPPLLKRCPYPLRGKRRDVSSQAKVTSGSKYPKEHHCIHFRGRAQGQ